MQGLTGFQLWSGMDTLERVLPKILGPGRVSNPTRPGVWVLASYIDQVLLGIEIFVLVNT